MYYNTCRCDFSAMPCTGMCVAASPVHTNVPVRGPTARRCRSCVRVRFPLLTAMDRHAPMGRYFYTVYTHTLPCTPIVVRAYRRGGHAARTRPGVRASALLCGPWARPPPRRRVRAPHAAAERRVLGAQAFRSASAFNANIGAWNTARVTSLSAVCAASGPGARAAADCARTVVDACAAVVRGGAADVRARARACACS